MRDTATAEIGGAIVTLDLADVARLQLMAARYRKAARAVETAATGHERLCHASDLRGAHAALAEFALEIAAALEPMPG
jgi:hypothetical protein